MKAILGIVGAIVLVAVAFFGYQYVKLQGAATQWDSAKEIASESIVKDGNKWNVEMSSVIDEPLADVWAAIQQPELLSERVDAFKRSKLKKEEGNTKVVELAVQVLTLPLQTMVAEFRFEEATHTIHMKTLAAAAQDLTASYQLEASPDGKKTLMRYSAVAQQKIAVPLPENVQKGAMKELFVKTVRAIKEGIRVEREKRAA